MFTSDKRVIRDGFLIAFEGEVMSDDEAAKRGLLEPEQKPKAKTVRRKAKPKAEPFEDEAEDESEDECDEDEEA